MNKTRVKAAVWLSGIAIFILGVFLVCWVFFRGKDEAKHYIIEESVDVVMGTILRQTIYRRDIARAGDVIEYIDENVISDRDDGRESVVTVEKIEKEDKFEKADKFEETENIETVDKFETAENIEVVENIETADNIAVVDKIDETDRLEAAEKINSTDYFEETEIVEQIYKRVLQLERDVLSNRLDSAEIYRINQASDLQYLPVAVSDQLASYLTQIREVSRRSNGAFDVTIRALTQIWNIDDILGENATQTYELPLPQDIENALRDIGYEKIDLQDGILSLQSGVTLDMGAVGKGIACDEVACYLESQDTVEGAVISVGGSILTFGQKPDKTPWMIGIADPRNSDATLGWLTLEGQWCVSTSGDYERFVIVDGVRYHHILDPATGYPARSGVVSVTILSKSGLLSDALSTACFVLGLEKGMELAQSYGVEALFVTDSGEMYMSENMDEYFTR